MTEKQISGSNSGLAIDKAAQTLTAKAAKTSFTYSRSKAQTATANYNAKSVTKTIKVTVK